MNSANGAPVLSVELIDDLQRPWLNRPSSRVQHFSSQATISVVRAANFNDFVGQDFNFELLRSRAAGDPKTAPHFRRIFSVDFDCIVRRSAALELPLSVASVARRTCV